ncbi:MAG TPA: universal stress protein [Bacteroidia bacterium]|jgi:nucleotide-binding universal stress UspA family protein|nr:universal stress protein [Bacteroidia bacterium]
MKTILVPTDFSKTAEHALYYAIEVAKHENVKLILLHAFHIDYTSGYVPANLIESEIKEAEHKSEIRLKGLHTKVVHAGKISCECISIQDIAVNAILDTIKKKNVDLVIMGTLGASSLSKKVFGTNTSRIIEKATCPVIAIPPDSFSSLKKITFATDYHISDLGVLQKVVEFAKPYKALVNTLHITSETDLSPESKEKMLKFKKDAENLITYNNLSFQIIHGENTLQKLNEYLENESTDLLVLSTHKRDLFDKLFGSSISKQLVSYTNVPLMVFHYKKKESIAIY